MTGWKCVKMSKPEGESFWVNIQDTKEGKHFYKFLVDGEWMVEVRLHQCKVQCSEFTFLKAYMITSKVYTTLS